MTSPKEHNGFPEMDPDLKEIDQRSEIEIRNSDWKEAQCDAREFRYLKQMRRTIGTWIKCSVWDKKNHKKTK